LPENENSFWRNNERSLSQVSIPIRRVGTAGKKQEPPPDFSNGGSVLTISRAYFAQQGSLTRQQAPPQQLSAVDVAVAVPTSAMATRAINRYFIESFC
jgi:hypothetical protein